MLDYDKKFLLKSADNLTFDGSSIRGFSQQAESDLRLAIDWPAFYWLPSDIFGPGKVLVFGEVLERDGTPYRADMRARLKALRRQAVREGRHGLPRRQRDRGLPLQGPRRRAPLPRDRQLRVHLHRRLLPLAARRRAAAVHRHRRRGAAGDGLRQREGPPRGGALAVRDELQLHRGDDRRRPGAALQAALPPGRGAHGHDRVLPAQAGDRRQRQRHAHQPVADAQAARTCSTTRRARTGSSEPGWDFIDRILASATDICLVLNSSVNAYRRLDPHFEAPNQIKASADRPRLDGAHPARQRAARRASRCARSRPTPTRTWRSTRCSAPGSKGRSREEDDETSAPRTRFLPDNIYDAIRLFKGSRFVPELLGEEVHAQVRRAEAGPAERCPKALGTLIKAAEVQFHHEVTNQYLWSQF